MKKSSQKRALERDLGKDKRRGEIVFLALFCVEKTEGKNIFANEKISRWKKETKRRQKASKEEENILSLSLCFSGGRASSLLPSSSSTSSKEAAVVKKYGAQEEKSRTARAQAKNPDIWWREEVLLGVLLIERSVLRARFPPRISHS
jgi:hypothetical protein